MINKRYSNSKMQCLIILEIFKAFVAKLLVYPSNQEINLMQYKHQLKTQIDNLQIDLIFKHFIQTQKARASIDFLNR